MKQFFTLCATLTLLAAASLPINAKTHVAYVNTTNMWFELFDDNTATMVALTDGFGSFAGATTFEFSSQITYRPNGGKTQTYKITKIGKKAFRYRYKSSDDIGKTGKNYEKDNYDKITSITIDEDKVPTITEFDSYAFAGLSSLTTVTVPKTLTRIGNNAFENCKSLAEFDAPNSLNYIGYGAFDGCASLTKFYVPDKVTDIYGYTFHGCSKLASVSLPKGLTYIGTSAFQGTSLKSVNIPTAVKTIALDAFRECDDLTEVLIATQGALTTIGDNAFYLTELKSIIIPSGVTSIGQSAFASCPNLAVTYNATNVNQSCFTQTKRPFPNIKSISFGSGVKTIPNYILYQNTNLSSVSFSSNVTSIGQRAFDGCTKLVAVSLPANLTTIGSRAFSGCTGLKGLNLPSLLTTVGDSAYFQCTGIDGELKIPAKVITLGKNAFGQCNGVDKLLIADHSALQRVGERAFDLPNLKYIETDLKQPRAVLDAKAFGSNLGSSYRPYSTARLMVPLGTEQAYHTADATKNFVYLIATGHLADIVDQGIVAKDGDDYVYHYQVDDGNFRGVQAAGGKLYAKDLNQAKHPSLNSNNLPAYPGRDLLTSKQTYDQSTWVAISGITSPDNWATGQNISYLTGHLTSRLNPAITVDPNFAVDPKSLSVLGTPKKEAQMNAYTFNDFCPANLTEQTQFFFETPQPNEVARVKWAVYDGNGRFYLPSKQRNGSGKSWVNGYELEGWADADLSLLSDEDRGKVQEGYSCTMLAILMRNQEATAQQGLRRVYDYNPTQAAAQWTIVPIAIEHVADNSSATSVDPATAQGNAVLRVQYVSLAGQVSDTPFQGVNVVRTTFTDGTTTAAKQIY